jgi:hypothetical protein
MADEVTIHLQLTYEKAGSKVTLPQDSGRLFQADVAGTLFAHKSQNIGTSEEALDIDGLTAGGLFVAINRDATNYVELRPGTGVTDMIRLLPGEACLFRLSPDATAPYAIANTAACDLEFLLLEV